MKTSTTKVNTTTKCMKVNRHIDFESELPHLERALDQGITVKPTNKVGVYEVTSSNSDNIYIVANNSCTCTGYWRWHYCKHIALVHYVQRQQGKIIVCEVCGRFLLVEPPMTADEYYNLHS